MDICFMLLIVFLKKFTALYVEDPLPPAYLITRRKEK
jgi:hypothetical protein